MQDLKSQGGLGFHLVFPDTPVSCSPTLADGTPITITAPPSPLPSGLPLAITAVPPPPLPAIPQTDILPEMQDPTAALLSALQYFSDYSQVIPPLPPPPPAAAPVPPPAVPQPDLGPSPSEAS